MGGESDEDVKLPARPLTALCQIVTTSNMNSFGRRKDQPQAATSALVLLFMISLLKPSSASATRRDKTSFNFPSFGSESFKLLDIQGIASVLSPNLYLTPWQPNQIPSGDCGQATYSREVHLWDKATGNVADFAAQFVFSIDSRNGNVPGDGLAFFVAPWGASMSRELGGSYLGLPKGSFVAVEVDTFKNSWDGDVPHVGIDLNGIRSASNVTVPWLNETMKSGRLVNASITYDSQAKNLSVVLMPADGNSSPSHLYYAPLSLSDYLPEWVEVGVSAATGAAFENHIVYSWEFSSSLRVRAEKFTSSWWKLLLTVTGSVLGLVVIGIASISWVRYRSRGSRPYRGNDLQGGNNEPKTIEENKSRPRDVGEAGNRSVKLTRELEQFSGPKKFSFEELTTATDSFAEGRILGKGGFGTVYEGQIGDARTVVAVKLMNSDSGQGIQEYVSEVRSISQLRHRNLVQLIGYCHEANNFALVYEFMKRGSLDDHLFKGRTSLTWERRYDIALGLASGLHYLHKECKQCVIHMDIKSSNTMLDETFEAKLGDFGLARLVDHARGRKTTEMIGTLGYAAPEYCETGQASKESDVYSFGVVLLEIACGKSAVELARANQVQNALVKWVWEQYGRRKLLDAVDSRLGMNFDEKQAKALLVAGLWCAHPTVSSRPSIEVAMAVLNLMVRHPDLPSIMPLSQHVTDPMVPARCFWL